MALTSPLLPTFDEAVARFDRGACAAGAKAADAQRSEILRLFPLADWPTMPVERYAVGMGDEDTYCRQVEFRAADLGSIAGGSAHKLIIFRRKSGDWAYPAEYDSERAAWEAVRAGFVQAFQLAAAGRWGEITSIEALRRGSALTLKSLHVYFPDDVLPVYSQAHLPHYLRLLAPEAPELVQGDAVMTNRALGRALRERPALRDFSPYELGRFLYAWADPREQRRVVKIAPGRDAEYWDDCLKGGYVCVGWGATGDLREFDDKKQFRARFEEVQGPKYTTKNKITEKANELWKLVELEPGDIVIANQGKSRVLAVGEVVEPGYEFRADREKYPHTVRVKWDTSYAQEIPPVERWGMVTVANVAPETYRPILEKRGTLVDGGGGGGSMGPIPVPSEPIFAEIAEALEYRGQVILYGPPGTGKTYSARRFAVHWLLGHEGRADRDAVLADAARFAAEERRLSAAGAPPAEVGRLTFLTFHPSYSYEDFVEGFRPVDSGTAGLSLRLEDGIFKRVCRAAAKRPGDRFVVLIDEFNRANVAKVLGELITLLEKDKRGLTLVLPQSKEGFSIPPNVYLIGTMNTADRSVKVLDAALRRRFAFIERMPDTEPLGATINGVALGELLEALNKRVRARDGREKQFGHAFFLNGTRPITTSDELARRLRHEVLPLLQEYCHDDYTALAAYLGKDIVDVEAQALDESLLGQPDDLLAQLAKELLGKASAGGE